MKIGIIALIIPIFKDVIKTYLRNGKSVPILFRQKKSRNRLGVLRELNESLGKRTLPKIAAFGVRQDGASLITVLQRNTIELKARALNGAQSFRWRILDRIRRFFLPSLRRPLPVFFVPTVLSVFLPVLREHARARPRNVYKTPKLPRLFSST